MSVSDGSNSTGASAPAFLYTGADGDRAPTDVTRARVDPSVKVLPTSAFFCRSRLREVELCDGLQRIEAFAFAGCKSLPKIVMPSTVEEISRCAFKNCDSLEEVQLGEGLRVIGTEAFSRCRSLRLVRIPSTVIIVSSGAFDSCVGLEEVVLPRGIVSIGADAFSRSALARVDLPDSLQLMDAYAFAYGKFRTVRVPPLVSRMDVLALYGCNRMFSVELPRNLKHVTGAFGSCARLRNVAVPRRCGIGWSVAGVRADADLAEVFPGKRARAIALALRRRFDGLPLHELCYYHSYYPSDVALKKIENTLAQGAAPGPIRRLLGRYGVNGARRDVLGMTPLHILACSSRHDADLYRLLIREYPDNLVAKDKWGGLPMLYALWGDAPPFVVELLAESQRAYFPDHVIDWGEMVQTMLIAGVPLVCIKKAVGIQQTTFPEHDVDWKQTVSHLVTRNAFDWSGDPTLKETKLDVLEHLLICSVRERLDSLNVRRWREDVEDSMRRFVGRWRYRRRIPRAHSRSFRGDIKPLYERVALYEGLKEGISLLELALWKATIDGFAPGMCDQMMMMYANSALRRHQCRTLCGAQVVIPNISQFLLPTSHVLEKQSQLDKLITIALQLESLVGNLLEPR